MSVLAVIPPVIFLCCLAVTVYVYAGFPILLWMVTRGRRLEPPPPLPDRDLPTVALVVAVHNEEVVIEKKLQNCLSIDYPAGKLTSVFVSDSTDSTDEILARYASPEIYVRTLPKRMGKVSALCTVIPECSGSILVFSDANTYYRPDSLRKLVRFFQDPKVGVVTGDVRIEKTEERFGAGEGLYYRYERRLQELETAFWSTVAVDGAMYAMRREHFRPPGVHTVGDDLVIGMNVGLRGLRILYDPEAIADEPPTPSDELEFNRKVRIVAYGIQACLFKEGIPSLRQWRLFWVFVSHKVLRWLVPLFLVLAFLASIAGIFWSSPSFWLGVTGAQILFYLLATIGWKFPSVEGYIFRIPYYFSMVNLAALLGIVRGVLKKQASTWQRTDRLAEPPKPTA
jgi:poly-beta-1,6-N-acetyl-D-glucosamine synthase